MVRIALVEDEEKSINLTRQYIYRYFDGNTNKYKLRIFHDGLDIISNYAADYDIIFLDIEMKFLNGMETAKKIREKDSKVILIFITQMAQFAARGYDVDAIGFMIKPVDYFSFQMKMQKAMGLINNRKSVHLLVTDNYERYVVSSESILYIEVVGHNVSIHTGDRVLKEWGSLKECAKQLEKANFALCSRYYLVNLEHVTAVYAKSVRVGTEELPLSRNKKKDFMIALTKCFGGNVNEF